MFERYPDESVRTLFWAKASALGADAVAIEPEHLLLGALTGCPEVPSETTLQHLGLNTPTEVTGLDVREIEFSAAVKRLLTEAMYLADQFGHHRIRPQHLLAVLLQEPGRAGEALRESGVTHETLIESAKRAALADDSPLPYQARLTLERLR